MEESLDFDRLAILFRRATNLPRLPTSVIHLIHLIDGGDASACELERIIASDPSLAATFIRTSTLFSRWSADTASLRTIIMLMGQRAVRSVAVSLASRSITQECRAAKTFDGHRYARHSLAVGIMARLLFVHRQKVEPFTSAWSADEMFSAGVLHDLGVGLLARVAPALYDRVYALSNRRSVAFGAAFHMLFGGEPSTLGALACETWGLPSVFVDTQRFLMNPWDREQEFTAISCLTYADHLAESMGENLLGTPVNSVEIADVALEVGLAEEERIALAAVMANHLNAYLSL